MALPSRFSAEIDEPGSPFLVELEVVVVDRRPTCSRLQVSQREGGAPVSTGELRALPLARFIAMAAAGVALKPQQLPGGGVAYEPMWGDEPVITREDVEGPRPMSDEHLAEVSRLYREALERGSNAPRKAIESDPRWHPSPATAGRWVEAARKKGFLGPATPRRAGEAGKGQEGAK